MEFCDRFHGVRLDAYEFYKFINNGLRRAIITAGYIYSNIAQSIYIFFPRSKWVFPLIENGVCSLPELPEKKFWSLRIELGTKATSTIMPLGINFPFPKKPIHELWQALVSPIDYEIPGSEYWPIWEPDLYGPGQGGLTQPIQMVQQPEEPERFGILADGPGFIRDVAIVVAIIEILRRAGFFKWAESFMNSCLMKWRAHSLFTKVTEVEKAVEDIKTEVTNVIVTEIDGVKSYIDRTVGLRLAFR